MNNKTFQTEEQDEPTTNDPSMTIEALKKEQWPFPAWSNKIHVPGKGIKDYEDYFANVLQTRYIELESEFQITFLSPPGTSDNVTEHPIAKRVFNLLLSARQELEQDPPNLLSVSSTLELVDRYLIWAYHPSILQAKIPQVISLLEYYQVEGKEKLIEQLSRFSNEDLDLLNKQFESDEDLESEFSALLKQLRSVLDEATSAINKKSVQDQTNNGLQIERLKLLRTWGLVMLVVFFMISPIVSNIDDLPSWPARIANGIPEGITAWISLLALGIVGALGGFFSGLLQARGSRVTLTQYQENMLRLQLKPLVGAIVSLVLSVLLSWQIIPGIAAENAGSYVLFAFLSGFSERYFLRLLELKTDDDISEDQQATTSIGVN